jgi:hypothetical protein
MFTKAIFSILLASGAFATPVDVSPPSIDALGISSLQGFDGFNGLDNFDGSQNVQVVKQSQQVVCQSQPVHVIQQRLAILQQFAQRIISEQSCEVETQTVVLEQFQSGLTQFSETVIRQSNDQVGFDSDIAGLLVQLLNSDGSLSNHDLGFLGNIVGQNSIIPVGNNWNDNSSPASTGKARGAAKKAAKSGKKKSGKKGQGKGNNGGYNNNNSTTTVDTTSVSSTDTANATSVSITDTASFTDTASVTATVTDSASVTATATDTASSKETAKKS